MIPLSFRGGCLWDHISPYFETHYNPESSRGMFTHFLNGCAAESTKENQNLVKKMVEREECHDKSSGDISLDLLTGRATMDGKLESDNLSIIPDVIIQEMPSSSEDTILSQSHHSPDVLPTKYLTSSPSEIAMSSDTLDIVTNSQNLLNSVNSTLSKSEEATKALLHSKILTNTLCDLNQGGIQVNSSNTKDIGHISLRTTSPKHTSNRRISLTTRENNRSVSRERRPSTSRHSRSRTRFSCDVSSVVLHYFISV